MRLQVEVWRQADPTAKGRFETHEVDGVEPHLSVLELLDALNEQLIDDGKEPVAFESDCREGICGACGVTVDGEVYDCVVSTLPPQATADLAGLDIAPVPYQGAACMTLALDRDVTDGIYWLNMKDAAPYGAVVSHTNFAPFEWYGEHIVYLASYFSGRLPEGLEQSMLADFCRRFFVSPDEVHWHRLAVDPHAGHSH